MSQRLALLTVSLSLLLILTRAQGRAPAETQPAGPVATSHAGMLSGTFMDALRLRRLHLVRPDLIPYPLMREYVC